MFRNPILSKIILSFSRQREKKRLFKNGIIVIGKGTISDKLILNKHYDPKQQPILVTGKNCIIEGTFSFQREGAKIKIGDNTFIGGSHLVCAEQIEIGSDVMISWGCTLIDSDAHSLKWQERKSDVSTWYRDSLHGTPGLNKDWANVRMNKISIGDKAWIGFNSIILKGVTIGEGSVIGAGSVVACDVAPYTVVAGNPAKVVKNLDRE